MTASERLQIIMGHPTLNSNVREAASAFARRGMLAEFHTSIDTTFLSNIFGHGRWSESLTRRALPSAVHSLTRSHPGHELYRLAARRARFLRRQDVYGPDATARAIDRAVSKRIVLSKLRANVVYAYEDSALESFSVAADRGMRRVYDLPIGYWRAAQTILGQEAQINPEWAGTLPSSDVSHQSERMERKEAELAGAEHVVVASTFTARTLNDAFAVSVPQVSIVPYGAPTPDLDIHAERNGAVKILFVGSLTQRKGISYLFDAVAPFGRHVELTLVGQKVGHAAVLDAALGGHTWHPSLPHASILRLMRSHDLLVFPSLFEGFGLVLTEALSQGLPIIATDHTAAPDLITTGREGWVVPTRSSAAIAELVETVVSNPGLIAPMRQAAKQRAQSLTWSAYRQNLVEVLERF